jgi:peptidoglycan-N-acetylglucosamine deacetylase
MYLVKLPKWIRFIYPNRITRIPTNEKVIYLTFDDGPNEKTTRFILDTLKRYSAKATFFCIGKNVDRLPELYQNILDDGHAVGNHTQHHLNGWKAVPETYIDDIALATQKINSTLFRPPYGRITKAEEKLLNRKFPNIEIVMWSVLSGDFDTNISGEKCYQNIVQKTGRGDIIVLHDSDKAQERMEYALPKVLDHFSKKGFEFKSLPIDISNKK